jgi:hypothetical protein
MPEGFWRGREEMVLDVSGHGRVKAKDLLYILGIFIGDGFTSYQERIAPTKTCLARKDFLERARDGKTGRFNKIGTEGRYPYSTVCRSYRIFFDIPQNDKCRKKVERTLSRLGIKYHFHKGRAGEHFYFTSKAFLDLFNQCGKGALHKHIPRWALEYSPRLLRYLLLGLLDSDGSRHAVYHTVSPRLASDISELCIKCGLKSSTFRRHTKSLIDGRTVEGDSYCVSIAKTLKSISRHRIKRIDYEGPVWCLRLKDNKNFVVEREGKFDFCGNTDEVYGEIAKGRFSERSPLAPNSPYAVSKAAADLLVKSYVRTHGFPAIIVRPSNNYGPWQYPEKLVPVVILRALQGQYIPVYARGHNVREWLHVSDCARAVWKVFEKGRIGGVYNVGSGHERRNIDTVKFLLDLLGKSHDMIRFVKDRPGHDVRYCLATARVRSLGWRPRVDFEDGMRDVVAWCLGHRPWLEGHLKELTRYWETVYRKA